MGQRRLVLIVAMLALTGPALAADEPVIPPEELKASVQKDCATFSSFCTAKHARIREALRRNGVAEAAQAAERLMAEEARTLKRVIWYMGTDRKNKEHVDALAKCLEKVEGTKPEDALKACTDAKFAKPVWLANPFEYKDGEAAAPAKDEATVTSSKGGASTTNYGVSGGGAKLEINVVSKSAGGGNGGAGGGGGGGGNPPPPDPPPPPPPPPDNGGGNGGGGGAGSGAGSSGSHSSN